MFSEDCQYFKALKRNLKLFVYYLIAINL